MAEELDSRTAHFGLRDALFYFVPGGVVLGGLATAVGVTSASIRDWGSLGESIVGLFCAYFLGQVVYPITYPLRRWLAPEGDWLQKTPQEFAELHRRALEEHPGYYASVVFRDRSFARFSLAMVFPSVFLAASFLYRFWSTHLSLAVVLLALGLAAAAGFVWRYKKYDRRYHLEVLLCTGQQLTMPPTNIHALD